MYDKSCDCGNPECFNQIMIRKGPVWIDGEPTGGWLHAEIGDLKGKWFEVMLRPEEVEELIAELCADQYKFKKLRFMKFRRRFRIWRATRRV